MTNHQETVLTEARDRFRECESWESYARQNYVSDVQFAEADEYNQAQWPVYNLTQRGQQNKACLTINQIKVHNRHIQNDSLQNKQGMYVRPVGGGSDYASAQIMEGIIRHIENISDANSVYDTASYGMIWGGIGWWRIITDYVSPISNDQEIFIEPIPDPMCVFIDKQCVRFDKSDAKYGFVFEKISKDEFKRKYPEYKDIPLMISPFGSDTELGWWDEDSIRICDYYRKTYVKDVVHRLVDGTDILESDAKKQNILDQVLENSIYSRKTEREQVKCYKIAGDQIVDEYDWMGKYIPLICCIGEETVINGIMDRKGHTRGLISIQRMVNYFNSSAAEQVALDSKTPWLAPVAAIEGYEEDFKFANIYNLPVLSWKHVDDEGRPIPPPVKIPPPVMAQAFIEGIRISDQNMFAASGLQQASLGEASNERSGKAIDARQRQAATATYHFVDHLSKAQRFCAKQLIDLIPKIYDTKRIIRILSEDSTQQTVQIDPTHPKAASQVDGVDDESFDPQQIAHIFNPGLGEYDIVADTGPAYATRQQEGFNALSQVLQEHPTLIDVAGDIWAEAGGFPFSQKLAKRMKNRMSPQILTGKPSPDVVQLQQMLAHQHQIMTEMNKENEMLKSKDNETETQKAIDWYKAETDRQDVMAKIAPEAMEVVVKNQISQMLGDHVNKYIEHLFMENVRMQANAQQILQPPEQQGDSNEGQ